MKKKVLLLACIILSTIGVAWMQRDTAEDHIQVNTLRVPLPQGNSWEDTHFREALLKGRQPLGYYVLVNEGRKQVKVKDLNEYCRTHDYYSGNYTTKNISRFGDDTKTVETFNFIPIPVYIHYVYEIVEEHQFGSNGRLSKELKKEGSAYFFNHDTNNFIRLDDHVLWSGDIVDGFVDGTGAGIWMKNQSLYYYFNGTFNKGFPVGKAVFRIIPTNNDGWGWSPRHRFNNGNYGTGAPYRTVEVGKMSESMALFRYLDNGEGHSAGKPNELYGYVDAKGNVVIKPTYKMANAFNNGRAVVTNDKNEDIYIDKTGQFIDFTEQQKQVFAAAKAREDSIAVENERQRAEAERQRILAEKKAEEERRAADAKEAAFQKRIEANKNPKLWTRGCRLAYRFPNGYEYVLATLEEWNENRTNVKIKIVASPSATRTLNGELLEKNNTMWVSATKDGWHLALDEEIAAALENDNSVRRDTPSSSSSSDRNYSICSSCNGSGYKRCYSCSGKGRVRKDSWDESKGYEQCYTCAGTGRLVCSSCNGAGRR